MEQNVERARDLLPSIVITVLSMIQALALELYWNGMQESEFLWQGGWTAALGWLQLVVMLLGMVQIWLFYVSLMLRFSWLPTMEDTLLPFIIGLLEFSMIDLMGPERLHLWFLALAAVFTIMVGASHVAFRRARQDPANDYYFQSKPVAMWQDYLASVVVIFALVMFAALIWISGSRTAVPLVALLFALAALFYQMAVTHGQWMLIPGRPQEDVAE